MEIKTKKTASRKNLSRNDGENFQSKFVSKDKEDPPKNIIPQEQIVQNKVNSTENHVCSHPGCKRQFSAIAHLKTHMFTHINIKQYSCPYCENTYSQKRRLTCHIKTHVIFY